MAALERPSAIRPSTSSLARGEHGERILPAATAEQQRDHLGIQRRAAERHSSHGVGEGVHIADAIFEQVARALGRLRQQVEGVGLLDVLREHEHGGAGVLDANATRCPQPLVGVRRRHSHVDDRDIRPMRADLAQQILAVARLADDLEAREFEQPCDPLARSTESSAITTRSRSITPAPRAAERAAD